MAAGAMNAARELGNCGEQFKRLHGGKLQPRKKERIEGIQDSAFLLNEAARFAKGTDAAQIRENFRKYVEDVNSGNEAARQAAQEGPAGIWNFLSSASFPGSSVHMLKKTGVFLRTWYRPGGWGSLRLLRSITQTRACQLPIFSPYPA